MSDALPFVVGSVSYGFATGFGIRLRDGLMVPTAAAIAPVIAMLAATGDVHVAWLLIGPATALISLVSRKATALELMSHVGLLGACFAGFGVLREVSSSEAAWLIAAIVGVPVYGVGEVLRQKVSHRGQPHIKADLGMWLLLQAVLLSAAGLMMLVVPSLGWATFVAMAAVLILTRREFQGFAESRLALEQTVRALDRLSMRNTDSRQR